MTALDIALFAIIVSLPIVTVAAALLLFGK
jgi:hypothetical protein